MGEVVAPIAEFFGGMLALCIVFGILMIATLVESIANYLHMGAIPLVGGALMDLIRGVVHALTWLKDWLWAHCNPVTLGIAIGGQTLNAVSGNTWNLMWSMFHAVQRITTVTVPAARAAAQATAYNLYASAVAISATRLVAAELYAYKLYMASITAINAARSVAMGYTDSKFNTAMSELQQLKLAIGAQAAGLVQTLQGWALIQLQQLRQYVNSTDAARGTTTQGQIGDAVKGIEGDITKAFGMAIAAAGAAAAAFEAWKAKCGDPLCTNLSGFGNTIAGLLGLVSDGALIALVVEAVANPQGVVDFIHSDIVGPVDDAVSTFESLVHWPPPAKAA